MAYNQTKAVQLVLLTIITIQLQGIALPVALLLVVINSLLIRNPYHLCTITSNVVWVIAVVVDFSLLGLVAGVVNVVLSYLLEKQEKDGEGYGVKLILLVCLALNTMDTSLVLAKI